MYESSGTPDVSIRDNTVRIGTFVEIPGSDSITPVDPERDVNGEPFSFVNLQTSVPYARRLLGELSRALNEYDLVHGGGDRLLPSRIQRSDGPGPIDPVDQELGTCR